MVSKSILTVLSIPNVESFFLQPDRILGAFLLDPFNPPTCGSTAKAMTRALRDEEAQDLAAEVLLPLTLLSKRALTLCLLSK